jgi:hypothetical protein
VAEATKKLSTLVPDMYAVLENDTDHRLEVEALTRFANDVVQHYQNAVAGGRRPRKDKVLYASEIGKACVRQLAYERDTTIEKEPLKGDVLYKFLYGNIIEELTLQLARSAGHKVEGEQMEINTDIDGTDGWKVRGRADAVIDGQMVDVKSASGFAFNKYTKSGVTEQNDSFGYREQLTYYNVNNPPTGHKKAAFLFVSKDMGKLAIVPIDDLSEPVMVTARDKANALQEWTDTGELPERIAGAEVPEGASGNMKLCTNCSYCGFNKTCFPHGRTFLYAGNKPVTLTVVKRLPKVREVT